MMGTAADVLAGIMGAVFALAGGGKLARLKPARDNFRHWRYSPQFMVFTGLWETAGAALLVAGIWQHGLGIAGAALLGTSMLGAVYTHSLRVPEVKALVPAAVFLAGAATTAGLLAASL